MLFPSLCVFATTFSLTLAQQTPPPSGGTAGTPVIQQELVVRVPHYNNASCPIMGKPISTKLFAETDKGRIYICCKSCVKDIRDDVETAHKTAYPVVRKLENTKCPVTGKTIGKESPRIVLQGFEIAVADAEQIPKLRANAQIYLTRMLEPDVDDLENEVCPVTGEKVAPNAYCLIGKTLVRLSSPRCVEDVERDPARVLQRAKELRGKRSTATQKTEKGS